MKVTRLADSALRFVYDVPVGEMMIECSELAGKIIRGCTIYEQGDNAAEVILEFTDDTTFSVCLKSSVSVQARSIRDEGGEPQVLKIFAGPPASH